MTQENNVQNILNVLKEIDSQLSYPVFVPSLKKELSFKQINIKQLKQLLKCVVDSSVYSTEYILTINNIIKENCIDKDIVTNNLTVLDKLLILVKMRAESISPNYTFNFTEEEINEHSLSVSEQTIDLNLTYKTFLEKQIKFDSQVFTHGNIEVVCNIPTLETENRLEDELHKNIKLQITTPDELRTSLGNLFINEVTKFIEELKINDVVVSFNTLDFKTRIDIVESLPVNVLSDILKYIEKFKEISNIITVHSLNIGNTTIVKELPQDPTFFSI